MSDSILITCRCIDIPPKDIKKPIIDAFTYCGISIVDIYFIPCVISNVPLINALVNGDGLPNFNIIVEIIKKVVIIPRRSKSVFIVLVIDRVSHSINPFLLVIVNFLSLVLVTQSSFFLVINAIIKFDII